MILRSNGEKAQAAPDTPFFNQTCFEDDPEIGPTQWSFVIFSPKQVVDLFFKLNRGSLTAPIRQAYEQELGIIEICKGDYANPTWVPLTPGLDVEKIRADWSQMRLETQVYSAGGPC